MHTCLILNTNNQSILLPSLIPSQKILTSLTSTLTPLQTLLCHISISPILKKIHHWGFTQFQMRLERFLSLKCITINSIAGYLPILVLTLISTV